MIAYSMPIPDTILLLVWTQWCSITNTNETHFVNVLPSLFQISCTDLRKQKGLENEILNTDIKNWEGEVKFIPTISIFNLFFFVTR